MPDTFHLDIVTPERVLYVMDDAESVVVPAEEGYLGIMAGHAPLLAHLKPGDIYIHRATGGEETVATSGGFIEVTQERVTILADTAEKPDEIDVERAREAYKKASDILTYLPPGADIPQARLALERAKARLKAAGQPIK